MGLYRFVKNSNVFDEFLKVFNSSAENFLDVWFMGLSILTYA